MLPNHLPLVLLLGHLLCSISSGFIQSTPIFIKPNSYLGVIPVFLCPMPYHKPFAELSGTSVTQGGQEQASGSHVYPHWEPASLTACQKLHLTTLQHSERLGKVHYLCTHSACRRCIIWFLFSTLLCSLEYFVSLMPKAIPGFIKARLLN